jgi:two-component system, chemotaxis family, protein-glutamate methylesterase/glutaminase
MSSKRKIRVLVVDDSFFMKKLLRDLLETDPYIKVVGDAKDGKTAIEQARILEPDVITMDYNMPDMTGAQVIKKILADKKGYLPAIIMISAYTKGGADETIESMRAGAIDFVAKPSGELSLDIDIVKDEILSRVHTGFHARIRQLGKSKRSRIKSKECPKLSAIKTIVIGASTGGPPVVEDILVALPDKFPAAIFVAQHMPEFFMSKFSARLNKLSPLCIKEAAKGDEIKNSMVYMVPADKDLVIRSLKNKKIIHLTKKKNKNSPSPSIDDTMASLAGAYQDQTVGVLLTGMGEDGKKGFSAIKKFGGLTIVQDPETAVIDSMPSSVVESDLADLILPPEKISKKLIELCSA